MVGQGNDQADVGARPLPQRGQAAEQRDERRPPRRAPTRSRPPAPTRPPPATPPVAGWRPASRRTPEVVAPARAAAISSVLATAIAPYPADTPTSSSVNIHTSRSSSASASAAYVGDVDHPRARHRPDRRRAGQEHRRGERGRVVGRAPPHGSAAVRPAPIRRRPRRPPAADTVCPSASVTSAVPPDVPCRARRRSIGSHRCHRSGVVRRRAAGQVAGEHGQSSARRGEGGRVDPDRGNDGVVDVPRVSRRPEPDSRATAASVSPGVPSGSEHGAGPHRGPRPAA